MALEAPSNCWTTAEAKFAEAVANATAFQSLTETDNATDAAAFVFGEQLDEPLNGVAYTQDELAELRHYAQVYHAFENPFGIARVQSNIWLPFGSAVLYVERLVRAAELGEDDVPQAVERLFKNRMGDLPSQIVDYLETNGGPHIRSITVTEGPGYNDQSRWGSQGMWQGCAFQIDWGLSG